MIVVRSLRSILAVLVLFVLVGYVHDAYVRMGVLRLFAGAFVFCGFALSIWLSKPFFKP